MFAELPCQPRPHSACCYASIGPADGRADLRCALIKPRAARSAPLDASPTYHGAYCAQISLPRAQGSCAQLAGECSSIYVNCALPFDIICRM
eukprot:6180136-Pleurochrysis_carterae.AAC.5